jgi:hypothetical protein
MNSSQKIKRIQLPVNDQEKPKIIGIVSTDPDYKLSLKINRKLHIKLKSSAPVITGDNEKDNHSYSKFTDPAAAPDSVIYLISNRSGKGFLLKQLRNIDFILLINGESLAVNISGITSRLREIDTITAVFNIEGDNLKDKNLKYLP